MIRTVIFDIDDTLYNYTAGHDAAYSVLLPEMAQRYSTTVDTLHRLYWEAFEEQTRRIGVECGASHSRTLRFQILLEWLGQPMKDGRMLAERYWSLLMDAMIPSPHIHAVLAELKARGIRLGIGTDLTADIQYRKLERLGLLDYFDFMVTSEESGADKPSSRFFDLCALKAGCERSECLFVGDNLRRDVQGANAAGMTGVWYQPDDGKAAEHPEVVRIRDMKELLNSEESGARS